MKPNELRIGNWVKHAATGNYVVFKSFYGLTNAEIKPEDYRPIPLTPEILEKAGFKEGRACQYWKHLTTPDKSLDISIYGTGIFPVVVQDSEFSNGECNAVSLNKIEFVHQLQNLYFALTGEELQIEL